MVETGEMPIRAKIRSLRRSRGGDEKPHTLTGFWTFFLAILQASARASSTRYGRISEMKKRKNESAIPTGEPAERNFSMLRRMDLDRNEKITGFWHFAEMHFGKIWTEIALGEEEILHIVERPAIFWIAKREMFSKHRRTVIGNGGVYTPTMVFKEAIETEQAFAENAKRKREMDWKRKNQDLLIERRIKKLQQQLAAIGLELTERQQRKRKNQALILDQQVRKMKLNKKISFLRKKLTKDVEEVPEPETEQQVSVAVPAEILARSRLARMMRKKHTNGKGEATGKVFKLSIKNSFAVLANSVYLNFDVRMPVSYSCKRTKKIHERKEKYGAAYWSQMANLQKKKERKNCQEIKRSRTSAPKSKWISVTPVAQWMKCMQYVFGVSSLLRHANIVRKPSTRKSTSRHYRLRQSRAYNLQGKYRIVFSTKHCDTPKGEGQYKIRKVPYCTGPNAVCAQSSLETGSPPKAAQNTCNVGLSGLCLKHLQPAGKCFVFNGGHYPSSRGLWSGRHLWLANQEVPATVSSSSSEKSCELITPHKEKNFGKNMYSQGQGGVTAKNTLRSPLQTQGRRLIESTGVRRASKVEKLSSCDKESDTGKIENGRLKVGSIKIISGFENKKVQEDSSSLKTNRVSTASLSDGTVVSGRGCGAREKINVPLDSDWDKLIERYNRLRNDVECNESENSSKQQSLDGALTQEIVSLGNTESEVGKLPPAMGSLKDDKVLDIAPDLEQSFDFSTINVMGVEILTPKITGFKYRFVQPKIDLKKTKRFLKNKSSKNKVVNRDRIVRARNYKFRPFMNGSFDNDLVERNIDKEVRDVKNGNIKNERTKVLKKFSRIMPRNLTCNWSERRLDEFIEWDVNFSNMRIINKNTRIDVLRSYRRYCTSEEVCNLYWDGKYLWNMDKYVKAEIDSENIKFPCHIIEKELNKFTIESKDEVFGPFTVEEKHRISDVFYYGYRFKKLDNEVKQKEFETSKFIYSNNNGCFAFERSRLTNDGFVLYKCSELAANSIRSGETVNDYFTFGKWLIREGEVFAQSQLRPRLFNQIDDFEVVYTSGRGRGGYRKMRRTGPPVTVVQKVIDQQVTVKVPGKEPEVKNQQLQLTLSMRPLANNERIHPENLNKAKVIQPMGTKPVKGTSASLVVGQMKSLVVGNSNVPMFTLILLFLLIAESVCGPVLNGTIANVVEENDTSEFFANDEPYFDYKYCKDCYKRLCPNAQYCTETWPKVLEENIDYELCEHSLVVEDFGPTYGNKKFGFYDKEMWKEVCRKCTTWGCVHKCICDNIGKDLYGRSKRATNLEVEIVLEATDKISKMNEVTRTKAAAGEKIALINLQTVDRFCEYMFVSHITAVPCYIYESPADKYCKDYYEGRMTDICDFGKSRVGINYKLSDTFIEFESIRQDKDKLSSSVQASFSSTDVCQGIQEVQCVLKHWDKLMTSGSAKDFEAIYSNAASRKEFRKSLNGTELLCEKMDDTCKYVYWLQGKWIPNIKEADISCGDIIDFGKNLKDQNSIEIKIKNFECKVKNNKILRSIGNPFMHETNKGDGYAIDIRTGAYKKYFMLSAVRMSDYISIATNKDRFEPNLSDNDTYEMKTGILLEDNITKGKIRIMRGTKSTKYGNCILTQAQVTKHGIVIMFPKTIVQMWDPLFTVTFTGELWQCESRPEVCVWGDPDLSKVLHMTPKVSVCEDSVKQSAMKLEDVFIDSTSKFSDLIDRLIENPVELLLGTSPNSKLSEVVTKLWKSITEISFVDYMLISLAMILFIMPWTKPLAGVVIIAWLGMKISNAQAMDEHTVCGAIDPSSITQLNGGSWMSSLKEIESHKCYRFEMHDKKEKLSYCYIDITDIHSNVHLKAPVYIPVKYAFDRFHDYVCPGSQRRSCKNAHCAFKDDFAYVTKCSNVYSSGLWDYGCGYIGNVEVCDVFRLQTIAKSNVMVCYELDYDNNFKLHYRYYCSSSKDRKSENGTVSLGDVVDTDFGKFEIKRVSNSVDGPYKHICADNFNNKYYVIETTMRKDGVIWTLRIDKEPMMTDTELPSKYIQMKVLKPDKVEYDYVQDNVDIFLSNNYAFNITDISGMITYEYDGGAFTKVYYHPKRLVTEMKFEISSNLTTKWVKECKAKNCELIDIVERDVRLSRQIYKVHISCEEIIEGSDKFAIVKADNCDVVAGGSIPIDVKSKHGVIKSTTATATTTAHKGSEGFTFTMACSLGFNEVELTICDQFIHLNVSKPYWDVYSASIVAWKNVEKFMQGQGSEWVDQTRRWLKENGVMKLFSFSLTTILYYAIGALVIFMLCSSGYYKLSLVTVLVTFCVVYVNGDNTYDIDSYIEMFENYEERSWYEETFDKVKSVVFDVFINSPISYLINSCLIWLFMIDNYNRYFNCMNLIYWFLVVFVLTVMYGRLPGQFILGYFSYPLLKLSIRNVKNIFRTPRWFRIINLIFIIFLVKVAGSEIDECHYTHSCSDCGIGNDILWNKGVNWTLHGSWHERTHCNGSFECLMYQDFVEKFNGTVVQERMLSFLKIDRNDGMCCHFQYREYLNHGCKCGISYNKWYINNLDCIKKFNFDLLKPTQCTYCHERNLNLVWSSCDNMSNPSHEGCKITASYTYSGYCMGELRELIYVTIPRQLNNIVRVLMYFILIIFKVHINQDLHWIDFVFTFYMFNDVFYRAAFAAQYQNQTNEMEIQIITIVLTVLIVTVLVQMNWDDLLDNIHLGHLRNSRRRRRRQTVVIEEIIDDEINEQMAAKQEGDAMNEYYDANDTVQEAELPVALSQEIVTEPEHSVQDLIKVDVNNKNEESYMGFCKEQENTNIVFITCEEGKNFERLSVVASIKEGLTLFKEFLSNNYLLTRVRGVQRIEDLEREAEERPMILHDYESVNRRRYENITDETSSESSGGSDKPSLEYIIEEGELTVRMPTVKVRTGYLRKLKMLQIFDRIRPLNDIRKRLYNKVKRFCRKFKIQNQLEDVRYIESRARSMYKLMESVYGKGSVSLKKFFRTFNNGYCNYMECFENMSYKVIRRLLENEKLLFKKLCDRFKLNKCNPYRRVWDLIIQAVYFENKNNDYLKGKIEEKPEITKCYEECQQSLSLSNDEHLEMISKWSLRQADDNLFNEGFCQDYICPDPFNCDLCSFSKCRDCFKRFFSREYIDKCLDDDDLTLNIDFYIMHSRSKTLERRVRYIENIDNESHERTLIDWMIGVAPDNYFEDDCCNDYVCSSPMNCEYCCFHSCKRCFVEYDKKVKTAAKPNKVLAVSHAEVVEDEGAYKDDGYCDNYICPQPYKCKECDMENCKLCYRDFHWKKENDEILMGSLPVCMKKPGEMFKLPESKIVPMELLKESDSSETESEDDMIPVEHWQQICEFKDLPEEIVKLTDEQINLTETGRLRLGDMVGPDIINIEEASHASRYFTMEDLNDIQIKCASDMSYDGLVHRCSLSTKNTIPQTVQAMIGFVPKLALDLNKIGNIVLINHAGRRKYGFIINGEDGSDTLCTVAHDGGGRPIVSRQIKWVSETEYTLSSSLRTIYPQVVNYDDDVTFYGRPFKFINTNPQELCYVFIPHAMGYSGKTGCIACVIPIEYKDYGTGVLEDGSEIKFRKAWKFWDPVLKQFFNPFEWQVKGMSGLPIFNKNMEPVGILSTYFSQGSQSGYINRPLSVVNKKYDFVEEAATNIMKHGTESFQFVNLPTGSGKSTKLPYILFRDTTKNFGNYSAVLVLNPLINSVEQLHKYVIDKFKMQEVYKASSIENTVTGNPVGITYMTYGHANVFKDFKSVALKYDYICFDEYHTMDEQVIQSIIRYNKLLLEAEANPGLYKDLPRVCLMSATDLFSAGSSSVNPNPKIRYTQMNCTETESRTEIFPKVTVLTPKIREIKVFGLPINMDNFVEGVKYCVFLPRKKLCRQLATWHSLCRPQDLCLAYYSGCEIKPLAFQEKVSAFNGCVVIYCTNYIESGVTIDFDEVYDTRKKCTPSITWDSDTKQFKREMLTVSITPQEAVQRAGRVGRFKPGRYYYAIDCDRDAMIIKLEDVFNAVVKEKLRSNNLQERVYKYIPGFICNNVEINLLILFEAMLSMIPSSNIVKVKKVLELCDSREVTNEIPLWIKVLNVGWDCASLDLKGTYAPVPTSYLVSKVERVLAYDSKFKQYMRYDEKTYEEKRRYYTTMKNMINYSAVFEINNINHSTNRVIIDWYNLFSQRFQLFFIDNEGDKAEKKIIKRCVLDDIDDEDLSEKDVLTPAAIMNETSISNAIAALMGTVVLGTCAFGWVKRNALGLIEETWVLSDNITLSHHQFWDWRKEAGLFDFMRKEVIPYRSEDTKQMSTIVDVYEEQEAEGHDLLIQDIPKPKYMVDRLNKLMSIVEPDVDKIEAGKIIYNTINNIKNRYSSLMKRKEETSSKISEITGTEDGDYDIGDYEKIIRDTLGGYEGEIKEIDSEILEAEKEYEDLKESPEYKAYRRYKLIIEQGKAVLTSKGSAVDKVYDKLCEIEWYKLSEKMREKFIDRFNKLVEDTPKYINKVVAKEKEGDYFNKIVKFAEEYSMIFGVTLTTMNFDNLTETFGMLPVLILLGGFTCLSTIKLGFVKVFWLLIGSQILYSSFKSNNFNGKGFYNFVTSHSVNIGTMIISNIIKGDYNSGIEYLLSNWTTHGNKVFGAIKGVSLPIVGVLTSNKIIGSLSGTESSSVMSIAISTHSLIASVLNQNFDESTMAHTISLFMGGLGSNPFTFIKGFIVGVMACIIELHIKNNADIYRNVLKVVVKGNFMDREIFKEFTNPKAISQVVHWIMVGVMCLLDPIQILQIVISFFIGKYVGEYTCSREDILRCVNKNAGLSSIVWMVMEIYKWLKYYNASYKDRVKSGIRVELTSRMNSIETMFEAFKGVATELLKIPFEILKVIFSDFYKNPIIQVVTSVTVRMTEMLIAKAVKKATVYVNKGYNEIKNKVYSKFVDTTDLPCHVPRGWTQLTGDVSYTAAMGKEFLKYILRPRTRVQFYGTCGCMMPYDVTVEVEPFGIALKEFEGCESMQFDNKKWNEQSLLDYIPDDANIIIYQDNGFLYCNKAGRSKYPSIDHMMSKFRWNSLPVDEEMVKREGLLKTIGIFVTNKQILDKDNFKPFTVVFAYSCENCEKNQQHIMGFDFNIDSFYQFCIINWGCGISSNSFEEIIIIDNADYKKVNLIVNIEGELYMSILNNFHTMKLRALAKETSRQTSPIVRIGQYKDHVIVCTSKCVTGENLVIRSGTSCYGIFSVNYEYFSSEIYNVVRATVTNGQEVYLISEYQTWDSNQFYDQKLEKFLGFYTEANLFIQGQVVPMVIDYRDGNLQLYAKIPGRPVANVSSKEFNSAMMIPHKGRWMATMGEWDIEAVARIFKLSEHQDRYKIIASTIESHVPDIHEKIKMIEEKEGMVYTCKLEGFVKEFYKQPWTCVDTIKNYLETNQNGNIIGKTSYAAKKFANKFKSMVNREPEYIPLQELDYIKTPRFLTEVHKRPKRVYDEHLIGSGEDGEIAKGVPSYNIFFRIISSIVDTRNPYKFDFIQFIEDYKSKLSPYIKNSKYIRINVNSMTIITESKDVVFVKNNEIPAIETQERSNLTYGIKEFEFDQEFMPDDLDTYLRFHKRQWPEYMALVNISYIAHVQQSKDYSWFYPPLRHPDSFKNNEEYIEWKADYCGIDTSEITESVVDLLDQDKEEPAEEFQEIKFLAESMSQSKQSISLNKMREGMFIAVDQGCGEKEITKVIGDGNCCFRALSLHATGNQDDWEKVKSFLLSCADRNDKDFIDILRKDGEYGTSDHIIFYCYLNNMNYCEHTKDNVVKYSWNVNWDWLHMYNESEHWDLIGTVKYATYQEVDDANYSACARLIDEVDKKGNIIEINPVNNGPLLPGSDERCRLFETSIFGKIFSNWSIKSREDEIHTVDRQIELPNVSELTGNRIKGVPGYSMSLYHRETDSIDSIQYNPAEVNRLRQANDEVIRIVRSFGNKIWYSVCRNGKHERPDAGQWVSRGSFKMHEIDDVYDLMSWGNRSLFIAEGRGGFAQMFMTKVSRLNSYRKHEVYICTGLTPERERPFITGYDVPKNVNYTNIISVDSHGNTLYENDIRSFFTRRFISEKIYGYVDAIYCDGGEAARTQKEASKDIDDYVMSILDVCYLKLKTGGNLVMKLNDIFFNHKEISTLVSHFRDLSCFQSPSQVNCSQEIYFILKGFHRYNRKYIGIEEIKEDRYSCLLQDNIEEEKRNILYKKIWGSEERVFLNNSFDKTITKYVLPGGRLLESLGKLANVCRYKTNLMKYEIKMMKSGMPKLKQLNYPKPLTSDFCTLLNPYYNQSVSKGLWNVTCKKDGQPIKLKEYSSEKSSIFSRNKVKKYGCFWGIINGTEYHDVAEELYLNFCNNHRVPYDSEPYPECQYLKWYGRVPIVPKYSKDKLQVMAHTGEFVKHLINNNIDVLPVGMASKTREKWIESIQKKLNVKHRVISEHDVMQCVDIGKKISYYDHESWGLMSWEEIMLILKPKASSGWLEDSKLKELASDMKVRARVDESLKQLMRGVVPNTVWSANHKREARVGCEETFPKPRIIQFMDGESRLLFLRLIGYIQVNHNLKDKMYWGSNTGRSITDVGDYLKDNWNRFRKPIAIMMDIKSWDTNVTCEELCAMCECFKPHFKKELWTAIETFFMMLLSPIIVDLEGSVFARKGQVSSGEITTSRGNGWLNITRCTQMISESTGLTVEEIKDKVCMCCEGDDLVMIMEEDIAKLVLAYSKKFLVRVNKPPKLVDDQGHIKWTRKFCEVEFCSHTYQPVPINDKVHYLPHRSLAELLGKFSLTKKIAGCKQGTALCRELNRSKAISYLLLYPGQPVLRKLCLMVLSKTGWGSFDTREFEYLFGHISGASSLMSAVRSVYGKVETLDQIGYFPHRVVYNDWYNLQEFTRESIDQYHAMTRCVKRYIDEAFDIEYSKGKMSSIAISRKFDKQPVIDFSFVTMDRFLYKQTVKDWRVNKFINLVNTEELSNYEKFFNIFVVNKDNINSPNDLIEIKNTIENRVSKIGKGFSIEEYDLSTLTFAAPAQVDESRIDISEFIINHKRNNKASRLLSKGLLFLGARVKMVVNR